MLYRLNLYFEKISATVIKLIQVFANKNVFTLKIMLFYIKLL